MNKLSSAFVLSAILLTGIFATMGYAQTANAKESVCKVEEGKNVCIITAKKGDVEIDKLTIEVNVQGGSFNSTGLEEQINNLEDVIADMQTQINEFNDTGITSIEIENAESDNNGGNNTENNN